MLAFYYFSKCPNLFYFQHEKRPEKKNCAIYFFLKSVKIAKLSAIKSKVKHDVEVQECSIWL